jgi:glycerol-3-phosphate dehydrogenase
MIALASRPVQTVINRCTYPGDGDIVVPIGTVAVLGTTDEPVRSPDGTKLEETEIEALIRLGRALIPDLDRHRTLRAWVGIRPLYRPTRSPATATRSLPRSHHVLDHSGLHGVAGLISVLGGKLTTYRLMAEQTVDKAAEILGPRRPCVTNFTTLDGSHHPYHALPKRLAELENPPRDTFPVEVVCECELVSRADVEGALESAPTSNLDDLRRELRLGMGPCQAAFCGYRAAGLVVSKVDGAPPDGGLTNFLQERWRGTRSLAWGTMLRQLELHQRIMLELLGVPRQQGKRS